VRDRTKASRTIRAHRGSSTDRVINVRLDQVAQHRVNALHTFLDANLDRPPSVSVIIRWALRYAADSFVADPEARERAALRAGTPFIQKMIDMAAAGE
jgi:hypothetical protein